MAERTLFVSTFVPRLGNGRELRTYTVIRALASRGEVHVLYVPHPTPDPAPEVVATAGVTLERVETRRDARRMLLYAVKLAQGVPELVARSCGPEVLAATRRAIADARAAGRPYTRVVASDLNAMAVLLPLARREAIVYNAHNVESSYDFQIRGARLWRAKMAAFERRILRRAAESWMVSRRDVELARRLAPRARLRYAPNVADVAAITPLAGPAGGDTALMLADFGHPPNREGLTWLVDAVLPALWARRPEARIRLCGRGLDPAAFAGEPRIDVRGFVDDVADAYRGAAAVIVPLTAGAGTPLKLVEALAFGVPIVATPAAARGVEVRAGEHVRVASDPAAFAEEVADLLAHGDAPMAARARALAEAEYSVEALARALAGAQPTGAGAAVPAPAPVP